MSETSPAECWGTFYWADGRVDKARVTVGHRTTTVRTRVGPDALLHRFRVTDAIEDDCPVYREEPWPFR